MTEKNSPRGRSRTAPQGDDAAFLVDEFDMGEQEAADAVKRDGATAEEVKDAAREAAKLCQDEGVDIAQLALQFSCAHEDIATCVAGSANPENVRKWAEWLEKPIPEDLLASVLRVFESVRNLGHHEGLPENN